MADVKWIKITTDMFDNRKIKHLRRLPDGNNIVLIWVMLLTMAGRCNSSGMIFLTENIPYTPKMLADELDFEENTVKLALDALAQLNMIVTDHGFFSISGWEEYQNVDRLAEIREYNRLAQQKSRAKRKQLPSVNDKSMTSQSCHDIDIDKEVDIEEEVDKKKKKRYAREPFVPPTFEEVQAYCESRGNKVDAKQFYDYFSVSEWVDSNGKEVKSWKQKVITWESNRNSKQQKVGANGIAITNNKSDLDGVF